MDWYRNAQELLAPKVVLFATDLIESEGHLKLARAKDCLVPLYNIDRWLLLRQSNWGNIWRNFVKAVMIPVQVWKTKRIAKANPHQGRLMFHAHTMYYMVICWLAGVNYVGTPQGGEILIRPRRSRIYRYLAVKAILAAKYVTVDSINMQKRIKEMCGRKSLVIQNGVDISGIMKTVKQSGERNLVVSSRGLYPGDRIDQILAGRLLSGLDQPITFTYPFWEDNYKAKCFQGLRGSDRDLGRLPTRQQMYEMLLRTLLVISIPVSDSSPRSVYEAIFCGCCVAVAYNPWIEGIPDCMRARLHLVDLADEDWFRKAIEHARIVTSVPYVPSESAMNLFDQKRSLKRLADLCYGL
jgi:hypothetical protein